MLDPQLLARLGHSFVILRFNAMVKAPSAINTTIQDICTYSDNELTSVRWISVGRV